MIGESTNRSRCIMVLVLVLGVFGMLVAAVAVPWLDWNREYDERMELRTRQLSRYQAQFAMLPVLQERLERLKADGAQDAFYLGAHNASLGGVALQRRVEEMVSESGGSLTSIQILPAESENALTKLSVRARLQLDVPELRDVLYRIEGSEPLMFVEQVNIRAMRPRRRNAKVKAIQNRKLSVNMIVHAYIRKGLG